MTTFDDLWRRLDLDGEQQSANDDDDSPVIVRSNN